MRPSPLYATTMLAIGRILVPIDFSEPSKRALAHARELGQQYQATLYLLHVVEPPTFPGFYGAGAVTLFGETPDLKARAERALVDLLATDEGREAAVLHVVEGHASKVIVDFVDEHDIDIVVIASRGLSGMQRVLMGSVAEHVVRRVACPVLVVKATGKSLVAAAGDETALSNG